MFFPTKLPLHIATALTLYVPGGMLVNVAELFNGTEKPFAAVGKPYCMLLSLFASAPEIVTEKLPLAAHVDVVIMRAVIFQS